MHHAGLIPGRVLFPTLRARPDGSFEDEAARIAAALQHGVGGFLLFGGTVETVSDLTRTLRTDAGRPLLIASDLERGAGQQVLGLAEIPPPLALASVEEVAVIRGAGLLTGVEALRVGINWVLAPVADLDLESANPIVQSRSFGSDPLRVSECVVSWAAGCEASGALACVKHFPGHGRTRTDSHDTVPVVDATRETLAETDLVPFRSAVEMGVSSVMTSHIAFPALDPSGTPATFSAPILEILRTGFGFSGLIASDALTMAGATSGRGYGPLACDAVRAGVDVLLDAPDVALMAAALASEAASDPGFAARLEHSSRRIETAAQAAPAHAGDFIPTSGSTLALGDWLLSRPPARGEMPVLRPPLEVVVVDDDVGFRYPPSSPSGQVTEDLRAVGVPLGSGGSRVLLVLSEPRASKGRAGLGPESLAAIAQAGPADLIVVFGHPRLVDQIPPGAPVMVAWHRQRLMQHAVARTLKGRLERG